MILRRVYSKDDLKHEIPILGVPSQQAFLRGAQQKSVVREIFMRQLTSRHNPHRHTDHHS